MAQRTDLFSLGRLGLSSGEGRRLDLFVDETEIEVVAIDRTSKLAFAKLETEANRHIASDFLRALIKAVPYDIHTVLTDNG